MFIAALYSFFATLTDSISTIIHCIALSKKEDQKKDTQSTEVASSGRASDLTPRQRFRTYDEAFKRQAVKVVEKSKCSVSVVARELGIHENNLLNNWVEKFGMRRSVVESPTPTSHEEILHENVRLPKELAERAEEVEILKKVTTYFAKASK